MIRDICLRADIEEQAIVFFEKLLERVKTAGLTEDLEGAMRIFLEGETHEYTAILEGISKELSADRGSVNMLLILVCAPTLYELYMAKGYSIELYNNVMADTRSKLIKYKKIYGIYGHGYIEWAAGFFRFERFAFGRLQLGTGYPFKYESYKNYIKKGDTVFDCHIPATGPLKYEDIIASLKMAHALYADKFDDGILRVTCHSWLLYPKHYELFPEGSNLRGFYDLFDIIASDDDKENKDFWRIFFVNWAPDALDKVPKDTTLRRNFVSYLRAGGCMGNGMGVLLFDGEKIIR